MPILQLDLNDANLCRRWDQYVKQKGPAGLNCQTAYINAITLSFGHQNACVLFEDDRGEIQGVLPLIMTKSRLFGSFSTSLPFFNYGGVIAENTNIELQLLNSAFKDNRESGASSVQLRESRPCDHLLAQFPSIQVMTHKVHMRLDVPVEGQPIGEGNAKQRAKLKSQAGLLSRKATEAGLVAKITYGHLDLLDDFYQVFSRHMRDLGTPVYGKKWFKTLLEQLEKQAEIVVTYLGDEPIATAFLITHGDYVNIPWASALKKHVALSPNTYMYWHIVQRAQQSNIKTLDFGRSTEGEGTYRFKKQWGAQPYPCYWLNKPLGSKGKIDNLSPANPKFSLAIRVWQNLPVWLTKIIGPGIVKSIP